MTPRWWPVWGPFGWTVVDAETGACYKGTMARERHEYGAMFWHGPIERARKIADRKNRQAARGAK